MKPSLFAVLLAVAMVPPAAGHDTWLLPGKPAVPPGTTVSLDLTSGMAYPAPETAIRADRVARVGGRLAGKSLEIAERRAAPKSLRFKSRLAAPGVAALWVDLAPRSIELATDEVAEYLDDIGAPAEVRKVWADGGKDRRWRELYTKHAKTFVRVGDPGNDRSWTEPAGMALEIVPANDPTSLRTGDELTVLVLADGQPLPGFPLGLVREEETKGLLRSTDAQGRVTFRLDRAGRWLLRGTRIRRSAKPATDWESDFTTLTLEVGQR
jgi:uncharacterized GH25 family protein